MTLSRKKKREKIFQRSHKKQQAKSDKAPKRLIGEGSIIFRESFQVCPQMKKLTVIIKNSVK